MEHAGFSFSRFAVLAAFCGFLFGVQTFAQTTEKQLTRLAELKALDKDLNVQWDKKTGTPLRIKGKLTTRMTGDAGAIARQFFRSNAGLYRMLDADKELRIVSVKKKAGNWEHVRLQQHYGSLPVEGNAFLLHISPDRIVEEVQGTYASAVALDTTPSVQRAQAMDAATAQIKPTRGFRHPTSAALVIYPHDSTLYLTWKVRVQSIEPLGDFLYYIDAHTGKVVDWYDNLQSGLYRKTYDANNGTTRTLKRIEGGPPTGDRTLDGTHDNAGLAYRFFWDNFQRDSWDGIGDTIRTTVHYNVNYNNAFWDGNSLTFGDGDGSTFSPLGLALDVLTHEFAHGVTQAEVDLIYRNQSGALNESYSDIFGALNDPQDWMMGEDCFTPGTAGDALRYLDDPPRGDQPDHMSDFVVTMSDNGGVHINSGIPNKAAYLMAQGGVHHGVTVPAMGKTKTARVFYDAYDWLLPLSDFHDAREATLAAVKIDFPSDTLTVSRAWQAVGIFAFDLDLLPSDQLHPDPNGGTASVVATALLNHLPLSGVRVEFTCDNSTIATVSPPSGTTDILGKFTATVTGHQRGNTPLHVIGIRGADTATAGVPVKVPVGSWPAILLLIGLMTLTAAIRNRLD